MKNFAYDKPLKDGWAIQTVDTIVGDVCLRYSVSKEDERTRSMIANAATQAMEYLLARMESAMGLDENLGNE